MILEASGHPLLRRTLLAASVALLVPWAAAASDAGPARPEAPPADSAAPLTSGAATNGVIVTWSSASRRFETPAPEQAAALVQELQRLLAGGLADRLGLAAGATTVKRTEAGLLKARVPAALIDLSVVHVEPDGTFAGSCTQGPAGALRSLSQAPAPAGPEER